MLSKTNKYKTKQTNSKTNIKKKEKKPQHKYTFYRSDLVLYTSFS